MGRVRRKTSLHSGLLPLTWQYGKARALAPAAETWVPLKAPALSQPQSWAVLMSWPALITTFLISPLNLLPTLCVCHPLVNETSQRAWPGCVCFRGYSLNENRDLTRQTCYPLAEPFLFTHCKPELLTQPARSKVCQSLKGFPLASRCLRLCGSDYLSKDLFI